MSGTLRLTIRASTFDSLKKNNPADYLAIEPIVEKMGPNNSLVQLSARELEGKRDEIASETYDTLFGEALSLREDRFHSYFFQLDEILKLPRSRSKMILEVGPGQGILGGILRTFGFHADSLDLTAVTNPTYTGDIRDIPVPNKAYDLCCAFEVLEHLPYSEFPKAVSELSRCAKHYVFISLPFANSSISLQLRLRLHPNLLNRFSFNKLFCWIFPFRPKDIDQNQFKNRTDLHNPHYWEVNRKSYPKARILKDIQSHGLKVIKDFHNPRFPYHYFILCEKTAK